MDIFQLRFQNMILLFCCFVIQGAVSQLNTKGSFFQAIYQSTDADINKNDATFVTTSEHHHCSREDQCGFVVDENGDSNKQISIKDEKDLKKFKSPAVIWKKIASEGYTDCKEAYEEGITTNGQVRILGKNRQSFLAYCDMTTDGGGWTVFQRRKSNKVDFQRSWGECKDGFGDLKDSFWLGLEAISFLTLKSNVTLRIDLQNTKGERGYAKYTEFRVSNEMSKYQLRLSYSDGNIGDSMNANNGMYFTTYDRDNDDKASNMAESTRGPWWHSTNYSSNLNNHFYFYSQSFLYAMTWKTWNNQYGGLAFSEMKLRRDN